TARANLHVPTQVFGGEVHFAGHIALHAAFTGGGELHVGRERLTSHGRLRGCKLNQDEKSSGCHEDDCRSGLHGGSLCTSYCICFLVGWCRQSGSLGGSQQYGVSTLACPKQPDLLTENIRPMTKQF